MVAASTAAGEISAGTALFGAAAEAGKVTARESEFPTHTPNGARTVT